jgi:cytochrome c biogenesis protein CcmG/thiol:disulfide interchange protein DsbE
MTKSRRQIAKKHVLVTALISVLGLAVLFILFKGLSLNPSLVKSNLIGKEAKDFEVELLEGSSWLPKVENNKVKLSSLRGKPVVLNFWASWCVSCRQEALQIEAYWKRYREKGIIVLGIAIQDTADAARDFAKLHGKTYPLALDDSGKTSIDYGVYGVPETFVIDHNGLIVHKEAGPVTTQLLEEISSKYLTIQSGP